MFSNFDIPLPGVFYPYNQKHLSAVYSKYNLVEPQTGERKLYYHACHIHSREKEEKSKTMCVKHTSNLFCDTSFM